MALAALHGSTTLCQSLVLQGRYLYTYVHVVDLHVLCTGYNRAEAPVHVDYVLVQSCTAGHHSTNHRSALWLSRALAHVSRFEVLLTVESCHHKLQLVQDQGKGLRVTESTG